MTASKLYILAIDPGVTTGIAVCSPNLTTVSTKQIRDDPLAIAQLILKVNNRVTTGGGQLYVVIEDFIGAGRRSYGSSYTERLIGWLQNFCKWHKIKGTMHAPQRRKQKLKAARRIIKVRKLFKSNHTIDALGHALACQEYI